MDLTALSLHLHCCCSTTCKKKKRLIKDPSSQDNTSTSCSVALWIKREAS